MAAPRNYVRIAALGDSVTYGIGDRTSQHCRGWARLLGDAIALDHDVSFCNLARPGATSADMRREQLGQALDHRPHLASLIVGLTDTMRSTWDPAALRADLVHAARTLAEQGARFGPAFPRPQPRLRPTRFPGPTHATADRSPQRHLRRDPLDLRRAAAACPAPRPSMTASSWSFDRRHPSERTPGPGPRAQALLEQHGLNFEPPALELDGDPATRIGELRSLAVEGMPWLARRIRDPAPALGRCALQAARRRAQSTPVRAPSAVGF